MTRDEKLHPEFIASKEGVLDNQDPISMTRASNPEVPSSEARASSESDELRNPEAPIQDERAGIHHTVQSNESEECARIGKLHPSKSVSKAEPKDKTAKRKSRLRKSKAKPTRDLGADEPIAAALAGLPKNVPIDGDLNSYSNFLSTLTPLATTVNRAKIHLAWVYGEALNAFLASPKYNRGEYKKLLAAIEMSWTKAHCVRQIAGRWRLQEALQRASYSDLLREMKYLPDREPRKGESRGVGDRELDAVDPPDAPDGMIPVDDDGRGVPGKKKTRGKTKKDPKGGRPALSVTHENVLLRLEEIKAQSIKIKTMNSPNVELAEATALYDRMRSELVEIIRILRDVHDIADEWVTKNGSYSPPTDGGE